MLPQQYEFAGSSDAYSGLNSQRCYVLVNLLRIIKSKEVEWKVDDVSTMA